MSAEHWKLLDDALATARAEIAAAAPDAATAAEGEAYLARVVSGSLAETFLSHVLCERGFSRALPVKGAPNPDYLLHHAAIDPTRRYRLTGQLNGSERIGVGLYTFTSEGAALLAGYAAFTPRSGTSEGRFTLDIAADASGPGTLAITPGCRVLLVRILHRDTQAEPGLVCLEGGPPPGDLAFAGGNSAEGYRRAAHMTLAGVRQFLHWTELVRAQPNSFMLPPPSIAASAQGDPDTTYFLGYYDLKEDEWLEVTLPARLEGYWSLHAYNHWGEILPGAGLHDLNAHAEETGIVRAAIGPTVPDGIGNRIDTLGRRRGMLIFRSVGGQPPSLPQTAVTRQGR